MNEKQRRRVRVFRPPLAVADLMLTGIDVLERGNSHDDSYLMPNMASNRCHQEPAAEEASATVPPPICAASLVKN